MALGDRLICDSQVHIWGVNTPKRPWPTVHGQPHRDVPYCAEEVIAEMDRAGVDRAIIVPPSWEGDRNDLALAAAASYPGRFGVMGRINLCQHDSGVLDHWRETPGMLGVRVTFHRPEMRSWLTDGTSNWLWRRAERLGLPVMLLAPGQTAAIATIARAHPGLVLIIDHLNLPSEATSADIGRAIGSLMPLTALPNVAIKVSALPCYDNERYPFPLLGRHIRNVIDAFGPDRCMWGSDISRLPCPYAEWVGILRPSAHILSEHEADLIGGTTASRILKWPA